ncbi:MAG: TRAP-type uncharacterized transport system substrate-binding protein [Desulforhopalus sp.]|jgi:TRAP-type uncharacterized transport system substrate-binding protein
MKKSKTKKRRSNKTAKEMIKIYGIGAVLALTAVMITYQFVEPAPPKSLSIATASSEGAYYSFANEYKEHFSKESIDLEVIETSGSVENFELLQSGKVDIAFLQGGIGNAKDFPEFV